MARGQLTAKITLILILVLILVLVLDPCSDTRIRAQIPESVLSYPNPNPNLNLNLNLDPDPETLKEPAGADANAF